VFLIAAVGAQEVSVPVDPGITPDNPLYFLDVLLDDLQEWIASLQGPEMLAAVKARVLEERLSEAVVMAAQNKIDAMERALYYVNAKVRELEDLSYTCPECATICLHATEQAQKVLEECIEKCPEQARKGLENAKENVKRAHERLKEVIKSVLSRAPRGIPENFSPSSPVQYPGYHYQQR